VEGNSRLARCARTRPDEDGWAQRSPALGRRCRRPAEGSGARRRRRRGWRFEERPRPRLPRRPAATSMSPSSSTAHLGRRIQQSASPFLGQDEADGRAGSVPSPRPADNDYRLPPQHAAQRGRGVDVSAICVQSWGQPRESLRDSGGWGTRPENARAATVTVSLTEANGTAGVVAGRRDDRKSGQAKHGNKGRGKLMCAEPGTAGGRVDRRSRDLTGWTLQYPAE